MRVARASILALSLLSATISSAFTIPANRLSSARTAFLSPSSPTLHSQSASSSVQSSTDVISHETLPEEWNESRANVIKLLTSSPSVPPAMGGMLSYFVNEYFTACYQNPESTPEETSKSFLTAAQLGLEYGMGPNHFRFGTTHKALRGGEEINEKNIDFYRMGCDFFKPAMALSQSAILGQPNLEKAFQQMSEGENVVFLANHQSEADPQVLSVLLETIGYDDDAAKIVYVAGHKVTTDTLAIPFSMGRNLICIHSKKHINVDPETQPIKQKQNLQAMSGMLNLMREGGMGLWVAPSGGRDRRDLETGQVPIAKFDQKTIDMFRLMSNKSKVKTHFYPLAMVSYDLCPPPDSLDAGTGEARNVRYGPVGIACGDELENTGGAETRHLFTEAAEKNCEKDYAKLLQAIEDKKEN